MKLLPNLISKILVLCTVLLVSGCDRPNEGIIFIVTKDSSVKKLADTEILFYDGTLLNKFEKFSERVKRDVEEYTSILEKELSVVSEKIENVDALVEDEYQKVNNTTNEISDVELAIDTKRSEIEIKQKWKKDYHEKLLKSLNEELENIKKKLINHSEEIGKKEHNYLTDFLLEEFLILNDVASHKLRSNIDGTYMVPSGAKYAYCKTIRLQNEVITWFVPVGKGKKFELKNSNSVGFGDFTSHFYSIIKEN